MLSNEVRISGPFDRLCLISNRTVSVCGDVVKGNGSLRGESTMFKVGINVFMGDRNRHIITLIVGKGPNTVSRCDIILRSIVLR